jgi:hypothetical protein
VLLRNGFFIVKVIGSVEGCGFNLFHNSLRLFCKFLPELSYRHDFKFHNRADHLYLLISGDAHVYSAADGSRQDAKVVFVLEDAFASTRITAMLRGKRR